MLDLEPAARRLAHLLTDLPDRALGAPTPCPHYTAGDLVDHVGSMALAFRAAAAKDDLGPGPAGPSGDASRLGGDWRTRIPRDLMALAAAWREPAAWTGSTRAGGLELPGEVAGLVALDELVVHGWDLARAGGRDYDPHPPSLEAVLEFVAPFAEPGREASRAGLFGPAVAVPHDAPLLDRVVGLTGRDPAWVPG